MNVTTDIKTTTPGHIDDPDTLKRPKRPRDSVQTSQQTSEHLSRSADV